MTINVVAVTPGPELVRVIMPAPKIVRVLTRGPPGPPGRGVQWPRHIKELGALGDGITDDTDAFLAIQEEGGAIIEGGIYLVDPDRVNFTSQVYVWHLPSGVIKQRSAGQVVIRFSAGSEGSTWNGIGGGKFDGNRAALKSAWTWGADEDGWNLIRIEADDITVTGCLFTESVHWGLWAAANHAILTDLTFRSCGAGLRVNAYEDGEIDGCTVRHISVEDAHNQGVAFHQHAVDFWRVTNFDVSDVSILRQNGDTSGVSQWVSGLTAVLCRDGRFSRCVYRNAVPQNLGHVPLTFVSCTDVTFESPEAFDFAGTGIEMNTATHCRLINAHVDGNYRATDVTPAVNTVGIDFDPGGFYDDTTRRAVLAGERNEIVGCLITRCGTGIFIRGSGVNVASPSCFGNLRDGIRVIRDDDATSFAANPVVTPDEVLISNPDCSYNGDAGIQLSNARAVKVEGGQCIGNGQDRSGSATLNAGIRVQCDLVATRWIVQGTYIADDQTWTVPKGLSFKPGTTDANNRYWFTRSVPFLVSPFQRLTLVGVLAAAADATGFVVSTNKDDIQLEFSSPQTFVDNAPLRTPLTGSLSSFDIAITGSGTAFTTQISGPVVLKAGGQYRLIHSAQSNIAAVIDDPYVPNLASATGELIACDVKGVPSQDYGVHLSGIPGAWFLNAQYGEALIEINHIVAGFNTAMQGTIYRRRVTVSPTSATINLLSGIPQHRLLGGTARVDADLVGSTTWDLRLSDAAGNFLEMILPGISGVKNTKLQFSAAGAKMLDPGNLLRALFPVAPTGGSLTVEALFRVDSLPSLPSL